MTGDGAATGLERLSAVLDAVSATGGTVRLWWRDDDLEQPTPALGLLLDTLGGFGIVPALAAIPARLVPAAVVALGTAPARLLVHGWRHLNHAATGAKKSEFGPERPVGQRLAEIAEGRQRLAELAGDRAIACFVPPWNRLGADLLPRLGEARIAALSGFAPWSRPAPAAAVPRLDTHVDLIDWRGTGGPLAAEAAADTLVRRICGGIRSDFNETPVDGVFGILSHHLVTDSAAWRSWRPLLALLTGHPGVRWLDPAAALAAVGTTPGPVGENETRRTG